MTRKIPFLIDLSAEEVFCTRCRKVCRSLDLKDFRLFWCGTKACGNMQEVRYFGAGAWKVFSISETLRENSISEVTAELVWSVGEQSKRSRTYGSRIM